MTTATNAAAAVSRAMTKSSGLSELEKQSLAGLEGEDKARAEAQLMLQKQQETVAFVANTLKKLNEIAMSVIGKIG